MGCIHTKRSRTLETFRSRDPTISPNRFGQGIYLGIIKSKRFSTSKLRVIYEVSASIEFSVAEDGK